ncbi:RNA polymerase subunit sigma-24 [Anaeromyxobacter paludicola]|uniref:RNA polymerase subunit sigma-24 n=2 Tax=Anaeromyxobacter paludicola TaxID=2918171 RepID=A0ABN6N363_9BACT|nr:RNA polymerase subunit sigma-24 [Anaeromyxobacter paludicola]
MVAAVALTVWEWGAFGELDRGVTLDLDDEAAVARAARQGDQRAFARLVDLHQRAVYGLCLRVLRQPEEARDAAQESFVRAWASLPGYDPAQPFAPWLLRIARNHCIDLVRRRLPASRTVELDAPPRDGAERPELADPAAPADVTLATAEGARAVGAAVATLPENYRQVIHLFHVEHLSYKEIAVTMEVPIGTVMTWLHRARARLREALGQQEERP